MRFLFTLCIYTLSALPLFSQPFLSGSVREKGGRAVLSSAQICIYLPHKSSPEAFGFSDKDGRFQIKLPSGNDSLRIEISMMGYKKAVITLPKARFNTPLQIEMVQESFVLNEVLIKSPSPMRLTGDTLNYAVSGFVKTQDLSIGDLLKRLPGINVNQQGRITYQGKSINKFYIEGKDLLGSSYNLATNNLTAQAFASVQVYQNHQPVKVLENQEFSDQAAINLKLKDAYKSTWLFNATAKMGAAPFLWSSRLLGAQFAKHWQSMHLYRSGNTGENIANDLISFGNTNRIIFHIPAAEERDMLSLSDVFKAPLPEERVLFNKTQLFATNHLANLGKNFEIRLNANYLYNKEDINRTTETTYYLPEAPPTIIREQYEAYIKKNQAALDITLKSNATSYFFEDKLSIKGIWQEAEAALSGTSLVDQAFSTPRTHIKNDCQFIKTIGKKILKVNSELKFSHLPQELTVIQDSHEICQNTSLQDFHTLTSVGMQQRIKRWSIELKAGVLLLHQALKTQVTGIDLPTPPLGGSYTNNISQYKIQAFIEPGMYYNMRSGLNLSLTMPLIYYNVSFKNRETGTNEYFANFFLHPNFSINWDISSKWNVTAGAACQENQDDIRSMYPGFIMRNYRTFNKGITSEVPTQISQRYNFSARYRNVLHSFMLHGLVSYSVNSSNTMDNQTLLGIYLFNSLEDRSNRYNLLFLNIGIAKNFPAIHLNLRGDITYNTLSTELIFQDVVSPYKSQNWSIIPSISYQVNKYYQIEYTGTWGIKQLLSQTESSSLPVLYSLSQKLNFIFSFSDSFFAKISGEHYYNELSTKSKTQGFFADAGLSYKYKKYRFSLDFTNITNQDIYTQSSYNELSNIIQSFKLRSRAFIAGISFSF